MADIQCGLWIPMCFFVFFQFNESVTWLAIYVECWARKLNLILMLSATRGGHCLSRTQLPQFDKSLMLHRLQHFQNKRSFVISRLHVAENWGKSLRKQLRVERGREFNTMNTMLADFLISKIKRKDSYNLIIDYGSPGFIVNRRFNIKLPLCLFNLVVIIQLHRAIAASVIKWFLSHKL